jgi:hypothetical protein
MTPFDEFLLCDLCMRLGLQCNYIADTWNHHRSPGLELTAGVPSYIQWIQCQISWQNVPFKASQVCNRQKHLFCWTHRLHMRLDGWSVLHRSWKNAMLFCSLVCTMHRDARHMIWPMKTFFLRIDQWKHLMHWTWIMFEYVAHAHQERAPMYRTLSRQEQNTIQQ